MRARKAWYRHSARFVDELYLTDFASGFRRGYCEVASGGEGCAPLVPPRRYWNRRFETPEGRAQVAAWFAGFPHGVLAAEADGADQFRDVPISTESQRRTDRRRAADPWGDTPCHEPPRSPWPGPG